MPVMRRLGRSGGIGISVVIGLGLNRAKFDSPSRGRVPESDRIGNKARLRESSYASAAAGRKKAR